LLFLDVLALAYQEQDLYFPIFIDSRGRVYYNSGHGLNPQGGKLARFLLTLKNSYTHNEIHKKKLYDFSINVNYDLVGLDVTCSGAQIIGGIIQDTKMLLDTNLIVKKNQKVDSKRSIYTEILNALMPEVKDYLRSLNKYGVEKAVLSVMNRDFVKGWTMRFLYSEGNYSRALYLISMLQSKQHNKFSILEKSEQTKIAFVIAQIFVKVFKDLYTNAFLFIEDVKKKFREYKKKDKSPYYIIGSSMNEQAFKTTLNVSTSETKQYRIYSASRGKYIKSTYKYSTDELALTDLIRGVIPNFIHHLDSILLYECVTELKKEGIQLFVVHDCFYIRKQYENKLKKIYFNAFKKKILEKDCYNSFLKLNNINIINEDVSLTKIDIETYDMSNFILTE
jgi:hypothetical protein